MLSTIHTWFNTLPNSTQEYFLKFLSLYVAYLDIIPFEDKSLQDPNSFLRDYLDETNLSITEELKRFLLAYATIDIIIQAKRNYDYGPDQIIANEIKENRSNLNAPDGFEFINETTDNFASGTEEQIWHDVISSWDSLKASQELSLININERILN